MDALINYLNQDFKPSLELWEKLLKAELKVEDVSSKVFKKTLEGNWSTLHTSAPQTHLLSVQEKWKKAAQTYVRLPKSLTEALTADLNNGVRLFFFEAAFIQQAEWNEVEKVLNAFSKKDELQVFLLGKNQLKHQSQFSLIQESNLVSGRLAHFQGGNNIQELALLATQLVSILGRSERVISLGVFLDSHVFKNIAKVRAAKLLAQKILKEAKSDKEIRLIGLTSFREWTLYERYSNILRNCASVASGYMAGADYVQSAGYQTLLEMETNLNDSEHAERSYRLARNTSHILALESMLGVVEDPAFGSYHLENLTENYAKSAWELLQRLCVLSPEAINDFIIKEATSIREERDKRVDTRRHVLAGMNDFPDVKEHLQLKANPVPHFYRVAQRFEALRLKMEKVTKKPEVYIAIFGDYAALNNRINFVKNYFELLGLQVTDPGHGISFQEAQSRSEEIIVLCSSDEEYPKLSDLKLKSQEKYLAGKVELPGYSNLFAGQNVYQVLENLVNKWGKV